MDNSELHYVNYDSDETWNAMMHAYIDAGGDILYPGDEKEILLRAVLNIAISIMARVDSALRMDTLTYATGEYLKEYGLKRNCAYIEAVAATAPVQITFRAGGTPKTIPAGTEMTADGIMVYETTEDIEQTGADQTVDTTIRCQTAGNAGNGLIAGIEMQPVITIDGFVSAITTGDATGGVDAEDEEEYRERIRNYGLHSITTGPELQYESAAMAVSSQIIDAHAKCDDAGEVGIYLIMAEDADKQAIIGNVTQALSSIDTRPLTDLVNVYEADEAEYTLNVKVWIGQYEGIRDAVDQVITEYSAWQDNTVGRAFNPDKLTAMLYQAGCERVQFLEGSGMSGEEAPEYTEIGDDEHCKGTITLTVVTA